jgi:hypothetical protein
LKHSVSSAHRGLDESHVHAVLTTDDEWRVAKNPMRRQWRRVVVGAGDAL